MSASPKTKDQDLSLSFLVKRSPKDLFDAIVAVRSWWSEEIVGQTDHLGAEFTFHYKDLHRSLQRISSFEPNKKIVWHVKSSSINFVRDRSEWTGTDIVFEIIPRGEQTEPRGDGLALAEGSQVKVLAPAGRPLPE